MATVVSAILVATGGTALSTGAAFAVNAIAYVGLTAASYYIQQAMQPKPETGTKLRAASGGAVSQSMIVGEKETAGSLIYQGTWGKPDKTPNAFMVRVLCLSDMEVDDITNRLWASGKKCTIDLGTTAGDGDGFSMGHPVTDFRDGGEDYMWVKFLKGDQTTADSYLTHRFGGLATRPWTASMVGRGRALMIVTEKYKKDEPTSLHECVVVPKGARLYDWRKDSSNGGIEGGTHRWGNEGTYEYTANPIVIAYNIMRGIYRGSTWLYGGQNWPARRFDNDSWTAAANVCDENVSLSGGGTENRYRMGAEINFSESPLAVLDRILAACNGRLVETGGIYKVYAGGIGASVMSFTDANIVISEGLTGKMFPNREDICNTITGSYCEPDNGGQMKAYKKRTKAAYVTEDNDEVRSREMSFDYVRKNTQAQRLAQHALNDNRRFMTKIVAFWTSARKLEPGDAVNWSSSDRFGFTNKKFIVGDVTIADSGVVVVALREADSSDADWNTSDQQAYTVGVYGDIVPSTQTINLTAVASSIKNAAGTGRKPALKISWPVSTDDVDCRAVRWQARLLDTTEVKDANRVEFDEGQAFITAGIVNGEVYQVRAKIIPESDRKTEWCNWITVTVGTYAVVDGDLDTTPAPDMPNNALLLPTVSNRPAVTSDAERDQDGKILVSATAAFSVLSNSKLSYEVRVSDGVRVKWYPARNGTVEFLVRSGVELTIRSRAISAFGIPGNLSSTTTYTPTKKSTNPTQASGLTATNTADGTAKHGKIVLEWNPCNDPDYAYTRIWRFTALSPWSSATLVKRIKADGWTDTNLPNGVTRGYWIEHVDSSGNPLTPGDNRYPSGNGVRGDTARLQSDDLDTAAVVKTKIGDFAVDTQRIEYHSISGFENLNGPVGQKTEDKISIRYPDLNWGANGETDKVTTADIMIAKVMGLDNSNPSPVTINGNLSIRCSITDEGGSSLSGAWSEYIGTVVVQAKKSSSGSWSDLSQTALRVRDRAEGSDDIEPASKRGSVSYVHKIGKDDAGKWDYRVIVRLMHRRGDDRNWVTGSYVLATCKLSLSYLRR
jgi:hypothetical protein